MDWIFLIAQTCGLVALVTAIISIPQKTKNKYKYCNEKECHIYNIYSNNFFSKKYVILE